METFYNEYFTQLENFELVEEFHQRNEWYLEGKIVYTNSKGNLDFDVLVPTFYPKGKIEFYCTTLKGYEHQGVSRLICLNSPPFFDIRYKINYEVEKLKIWIEKYYINDEVDERYEYPMFKFQSPNRDTLIFNEEFYENSEDRFRVKCGEFKFSYLISKNTKAFIATEIGNQICTWSIHYRNNPTSFKGVWVFLNQEPIIQRKERIVNWTDLVKLLPSDFENCFYEICSKNSKDKFIGDHYYIAVGYKIPNLGFYEIQWDLILLPKKIFTPKVIKKRTVNFQSYKEDIIWGFTYNASYSRLFGRGILTNALVNSKVLIIGLGAIGSILASYLTRGGQKQISLWDNDYVEPGNEVRSFYDFIFVNERKTTALGNKLVSISPYVEIVAEDKSFLTSKSLKNFTEYKNYLDKFDFIFDCTANMDVAYALNELQSKARIINFSITDNAKEFVCVCGVGDVALKKDLIFNKLGAVVSEGDFYPGTGCWQPTFRANNLDINVLLSYAMQEINQRLENELDLSSFVISKSIENNNVKLKLDYEY